MAGIPSPVSPGHSDTIGFHVVNVDVEAEPAKLDTRPAAAAATARAGYAETLAPLTVVAGPP